MPRDVLYVLAIVAVALVFDFINGFHDSANSIATVVSTRVLSPGRRGGLGGGVQRRSRPSWWAPRWPGRSARV